MTRFLKLLLDESSKVPSSEMPPLIPVDEGETVVGKLDADLLQLYILRAVWHKRLLKLLNEHEHIHVDLRANPEDQDKKREHESLLRRYAVLDNQYDAVDRLFWASVRTEFHDIPAGDIGIRQDGKVVILKPGSEGPGLVMLQLLRHVL